MELLGLARWILRNFEINIQIESALRKSWLDNDFDLYQKYPKPTPLISSSWTTSMQD